MSTTRFNLAAHLRDEFKNSKVKEEAIKSSLEKLKNDDVTRIFDQFPPLLSPTLIEYLTNQFIRALPREENNQAIETNENLILNPTTQQKIIHYQKEIARIGRLILFDKNKSIDPNIIEICEWQNFKNKIDPCDLLCAFVGALNQEVMKNPKVIDLIFKNQATGTAIFHFINQYRDWTKDVLDEAEFHYIGKFNRSHPRSTPEFKISENGTPLALGILAGLGTAVAVGITLFNQYAANQDKGTSKAKPPQKPEGKFKFN